MSYHSKETFGDMDVLVYDNGFEAEQIKSLIKKLDPAEIFRTSNSNVYSFDYKNLQIDLIFVKPENWEASKIFFQWGDLGNLMGKLFNSYGGKIKNYHLKYGYDGIKVKVMYKGYKEVVYLSKNNEDMFKFLGLDFKAFKEGFSDQEEMYDYVISSKLFSYDIFQWENLSSINKQRNSRRPGYHAFLEYIEKYKDHVIEYIMDDEYYINKLNDFFEADLQKEMGKLVNKVDRIKAVREKFSGKNVMEKFGIEGGKELGVMMNRFRKFCDEFYPYGNYEDFILGADIHVILSQFKRVNEL